MRRLTTALRRWLYLAVPLVILILVVWARLHAPALVERQQLMVFDLYQKLMPRPYTPVPIKIIDIDDQSLKRVGQWPWPRTLLATLVEALFAQGAIVVAFDVVFAEPDRTSPAYVLPIWRRALSHLKEASGDAKRLTEIPSVPSGSEGAERLEVLLDHDRFFAESIMQQSVVTGFVLTQEETEISPSHKWEMLSVGRDPRPFLPKFRGAVVNVAAIDQAAAGTGSLNLVPERDNVVRRASLILCQDDTIYPSLAAETMRVFLNERSYTVRTKRDPVDWLDAASIDAGVEAVEIGVEPIPTDRQGRFWIHYTRSEPSRYVPAWRFFDGSFDGGDLAGSLVFVGATAAGLHDLHATPLKAVVPGIEIHASILEQMLLGEFLERPDWATDLETVYLILLGTVPVLLLRRLGMWWAASIGFAAMVIAIGYGWYGYVEHRWLLDMVGPSLAVLLIYLVGASINFAQSEAERRYLRRAFNHYLAPAVIEQLVSDPRRLSLQGERREMTFLFTDIAGFTSLTEHTHPELLVALLNEYLDATCSIVLRAGGTIDKIVGDALHVMFNAPVVQPDHASRAVNCALALDRFCEDFVKAQRERGISFGHTRIGVNTGHCVVGNFGGGSRFDYTAHGDAINTAARLESVNQHVGIRMCVSDTTAGQCPDIAFRPVGRLVLKGKAQGIEVFEPLPEDEAASPRRAQYLGAYQLLDRGDPAAVTAFKRLKRQFPEDGLIALHARRIAAGESGVTIVMHAK